MDLSSPVDSTLLQNKFLNLVVVLWFWYFGRFRDWKGPGCSGIHGEFALPHVTVSSLGPSDAYMRQ